MSLIIDGYNLLNAAGIIPKGNAPGTLERARNALLRFLAASIDPDELARTTIVFDAGADSPRGLPQTANLRGMTIRFARNYDDADMLIEELIKQDSAPRNLTVVSSDHRLHRAARRRRARAVDSDRWYAEIVRRRRKESSAKPRDKKPQTQSDEDVRFWLDQFACEETTILEQQSSNPFPPGYGEDIDET